MIITCTLCKRQLRLIPAGSGMIIGIITGVFGMWRIWWDWRVSFRINSIRVIFLDVLDGPHGLEFWCKHKNFYYFL